MARVLASWIGLVLVLASTLSIAAARVGEVAPDIVLGKTLDGQAAKASDHLGKVVVISFWASWCEPCREELPILEALQKQGKGNIQVVAVNVESRQRFLQASRVLGNLLLTLANDSDHRSQSEYGVKGIPQMVIIGKDGRIIAIHRGYGEKSIDGIVAEINRALAETSATTTNAAAAGAE